MKCPDCEEENRAGSVKCSGGGEPLATGAIKAEEIPNYFLESILVTIFCCQPLGIVALVYATQVKSFLIGGFIKEALEASEKAKNWSMAGFWSALVLIAVSPSGYPPLSLRQGSRPFC